MSSRVMLAFALGGVACAPACAVDLVLDDVAPDRLERQRTFVRNELPLPGTPDLSRLDQRLKEHDLVEGRPIYIRIFKAESELELWMQNSKGTFSRLASYPICHWYGSLGPKLKEGDKQSPEGFYRVGVPQTRLVGRWRKAFNLGFPNVFDQRLGRTGSYILIHGGCSSVGCFAMTDPVQDEIYRLARSALAKGQERFSVHIFPFRMTPENLARYANHSGSETWADLKPAYDSFERTQVPPRVAVCGLRYKIADGLPGETGGVERRLPVLAAANGAAKQAVESDWQPPTCRLDDEDQRISFYSGTSTPITTAATTTETATDASPEPAPPAPDKRSIESDDPPAVAEPRVRRPLRRAVPTKVTRVAEPEPARARVTAIQRPSPRRPSRRNNDPETRVTSTPAADGFGNSAIRGTQRISSHGG